MSGSFDDFEIDMKYDPTNVTHTSISVKIAVASLDTGNTWARSPLASRTRRPRQAREPLGVLRLSV